MKEIKKICFVISDSQNIIDMNLPEINLNSQLSIEFSYLYREKKVSWFIRVLRKILYFSGMTFFNLFYGNWTRYLNDLSVQLVFFDATKPYHRLANVMKKAINNPFVYIWNPVSATKCKPLAIKKKFKVFSYSINDCEKYGLHFNHSFFVKSKFPIRNLYNEIYDVVFVGQNKNRIKSLEKIYSFVSKPMFWVVKDCNEKSDLLQMKERGENLEYSKYLELVSHSKAILEIVNEQDVGDTLRVAEAVSLQKKLITNHLSITKQFFYKENNILLIDENTTSRDINEFLSLPMIPYSKDEQEYFSIKLWAERFLHEN